MIAPCNWCWKRERSTRCSCRAPFQTFTDRPVANGNTTQVLLAFDVALRHEVDELISRALANGGRRYTDPKDHGWMYYDSFANPDGHQWEVMHADPSKRK